MKSVYALAIFALLLSLLATAVCSHTLFTTPHVAVRALMVGCIALNIYMLLTNGKKMLSVLR